MRGEWWDKHSFHRVCAHGGTREKKRPADVGRRANMDNVWKWFFRLLLPAPETGQADQTAAQQHERGRLRDWSGGGSVRVNGQG